MQTGTKISGIAHIGLISWALFGGVFSSEPLPFEMREVSIITEEQYAALTAPRNTDTSPEQPAAEPASEPQVVPEPVPEPEPEPVVEPEPIVEPEPTPEPEPEPEPVVVPEPAEPSPSDRVAPEPVATPPPDVTPDEEAAPEVAPDEGAETPQDPQEATAPEEATDRIVPETDVVAALAPARSPRPPARRPTPSQAEPETTAEPVAESQPEPEADPASEIDVSGALAEALANPVPAGPPLSSGEKDALRVAVQRCWNVGSLSSAAIATTVVVAVSMTADGKPETGTIRMLSSSGGTADSANKAFGAARRAIIRCGASGFDLPADKYEQWREIEMTFNPERMRIK